MTEKLRLKQRISEDQAFIINALVALPIDEVLPTIQSKYPEAYHYVPYSGLLFFREKQNDWGLRIEIEDDKQVLVMWDLEKRVEEYFTEFDR